MSPPRQRVVLPATPPKDQLFARDHTIAQQNLRHLELLARKQYAARLRRHLKLIFMHSAHKKETSQNLF